MIYVVIGIGGAVGALLRYFISLLFVGSFSGFPIATIIVNLSGAFLLALLFSLLTYYKIHTYIVQALCTGVIGSFTTFSTFSLDFVLLIENKAILQATVYFFISSLGGLLFAWAGYRLSKLLTYKKEGWQMEG